MNNITKVSEITVNDVADYLRLTEFPLNTDTSNDTTGDDAPVITDEEQSIINTLTTMINVSKTFISNYTGRTIEDLDKYQDFIIVVLILCQDMWDTRTLYVDKSNLNKVVETILGMHSVNLLPKED